MEARNRKQRWLGTLVFSFVLSGPATPTQGAAACPSPLVEYGVELPALQCEGSAELRSTKLSVCAGRVGRLTSPAGVPARRQPAEVCGDIDAAIRALLYSNRDREDGAVCPEGRVTAAVFNTTLEGCEGQYVNSSQALEAPEGLEACWVKQRGDDCVLIQVRRERPQSEIGFSPFRWKDVETSVHTRCRSLFVDLRASTASPAQVLKLEKLFTSREARECSDPRLKIWYDARSF